LGEGIEFVWLPGSSLGLVKMDPSQIDQILANLCVNASDAISGIGKITLETHNVEFDEAYCLEHPGYLPGKYVQLVVSDNGTGMDQETLKNIFELLCRKGLV
ncbi:MAG TPA: hybrid sensor histidine kinase/response regulator, partial [Planctomycetaceae bacterium]|nr:hybrid sensor histidine kinase/response regulator [Planctomycetaceae bacterium]